jgi:hypothetical protein
MTHQDFIAHLSGRVDETKAKLEDARARVLAAKADEDQLAADLAAYERTLAAERRVRGIEPEPEPKRDVDLLGEPVREDGTKTAFVFHAIRQAGSAGMSNIEIYQTMLRADPQTNRNYAYNVVSRLKEQNRIERRGDRFYAK